MSILSGGSNETNPPEPQPGNTRGGKYGNLGANRKAKGRRDNLKFFDSADWAMRNQNAQQQNAQGQPGAPAELPNANFAEIPDSSLQDESNSVLANDSQSPISSPKCGCQHVFSNADRDENQQETSSLLFSGPNNDNDNDNSSPLSENRASTHAREIPLPANQAQQQEGQPQRSKFGNLKKNTKARNRREGVKFFDSADWAMSGKNNDNQEQGNETPKAQFSQIPNSENNEGESPLAETSSLLA